MAEREHRPATVPDLEWRVIPPDTIDRLAKDLHQITEKNQDRAAVIKGLNRLHRCSVTYEVKWNRPEATDSGKVKLDQVVWLVVSSEPEGPKEKQFIERVSTKASLLKTIRHGIYLKDTLDHYRMLRSRSTLG